MSFITIIQCLEQCILSLNHLIPYISMACLISNLILKMSKCYQRCTILLGLILSLFPQQSSQSQQHHFFTLLAFLPSFVFILHQKVLLIFMVPCNCFSSSCHIKDLNQPPVISVAMLIFFFSLFPLSFDRKRNFIKKEANVHRESDTSKRDQKVERKHTK